MPKRAVPSPSSAESVPVVATRSEAHYPASTAQRYHEQGGEQGSERPTRTGIRRRRGRKPARDRNGAGLP